jgi:hypothetical protein
MRRLVFAMFAALSLLIALTVSSGAQADLGNDGIDKNCSTRDFDSVEEARAYFANDGGSATRNVDDLDRNGDGIACNSGLTNDGGSGDDTGSGDTGNDTGSGDTGNDTGSGDNGGDATDLPNTGVGAASMSSGTEAALFGVMAAVLIIVGSIARRSESFRR